MTNLPAPRKARLNIGNLTTARAQVGVGGGASGRFLSIDRDTGAMTVGTEREPFDDQDLWAVRVEEILWGYYVFEGGGAPDKTAMVPMVSKPKPIPPMGYAPYPDDGARDALELKFHPLKGDEPIEFTSMSVSHSNRINNLLGAIVNQSDLPDGDLGFVNPVIRVIAGSYPHRKWGRIHHFDFKIMDWCDDSGEVLLSAYRNRAVTDQSEKVIDEDDIPFEGTAPSTGDGEDDADFLLNG